MARYRTRYYTSLGEKIAVVISVPLVVLILIVLKTAYDIIGISF